MQKEGEWVQIACKIAYVINGRPLTQFDKKCIIFSSNLIDDHFINIISMMYCDATFDIFGACKRPRGFSKSLTNPHVGQVNLIFGQVSVENHLPKGRQ